MGRARAAGTLSRLPAGAVRCWGNNVHGQLGYGHNTQIGDDETPASAGDILLGASSSSVALGALHSCALVDAGAVRCWGLNSSGQLGYGAVLNVNNPSSAGDVPLGAGPVVEVAPGQSHTCVRLGTGAVRCWGGNAWGQLGQAHATTIGDDEPASVVGNIDLGEAATAVVSGSVHSCAVLASGAVRCWGNNALGQLGYGHTDPIGDTEVPGSVAPVALGGSAVALAAGQYHTCALLASGSVRCWGRNDQGQLGYGHTDTIGDDEDPTSAGNVAIE